MKSHPVWVRGLKHQGLALLCRPLPVAPRVGAWIETCRCTRRLSVRRSHPVWVRGLKHHGMLITSDMPMSHPVWVRGLKQD